MSNDKIYSYHNFMFPFRFDKIIGEIEDRHSYYKYEIFDNRVKIDEDFKAQLESDGWSYQKHIIGTNLDYNEFVYFHDFTRDTLFNTQEFGDGATSYYFDKSVDCSSSFTIKIKDNRSYYLSLVGVSLRVFDTGVAILSFELENRDPQQSHIDDILKINDFGRRIYPQFLGRYSDKSEWTEATKGAFLADEISLCINGDRIIEKFNYTEIPKEIKIAKHIIKILGENTFTTTKSEDGKNFIQPSVDDRMFVICWYGDENLSQELKGYNYISSDKWYKYIFIDNGDKTIQSPKMQERFIKEATYDRWMDYKEGLTLFGMSRYSFVSLSNSSWFSKNILPLPHIRTMYYQMFTLLLAQRASILRFSDEVTALSDISSRELKNNQISNLYKNYIRFVNKLYFREITPQDQGLEIYNQARGILKIDGDIKDLDKEIDELYQYAKMLEDNERTQKMDNLSKMGYMFLPPTLVAGLFGMNVFPEHFIDNICGLIISFGSIIGLTWWIGKINNINIKEFFIKKGTK